MPTRLLSRALPRVVAVALTSLALVLGSAAPSQAVGTSPIGNLDKAYAVTGGVRVTGWAWDPSTTSAVTVMITVGGVTTSVLATGERRDVDDVFPDAGDYRGFSKTVSIGGGTHKVCATAVDVGEGSNTTFPCKYVTVSGSSTTTAVASTSTSTSSTGKPSASNTGVPSGVSLRRHDGDLVITTPGKVISGLDIRGFVDVRASNVTIKNSIIRGRSTSSDKGLVTVRSSTYSLKIEDSELAPLNASPYIDGLRGMNITARRLDIHRVIDSAHIYGSNVLLENNWMHDNAHFRSDPNWGGRPSHDDSIQIQRGSNIVIRNNNVSGSHSAAIMVTQDAGSVSNLKVAKNWLDGGACVVNFKKASSAPKYVSLTDNTFGRNAIYPNCGIKVPSWYPLDLQRNYFTDGRSVPRTA